MALFFNKKCCTYLSLFLLSAKHNLLQSPTRQAISHQHVMILKQEEASARARETTVSKLHIPPHPPSAVSVIDSNYICFLCQHPSNVEARC